MVALAEALGYDRLHFIGTSGGHPLIATRAEEIADVVKAFIAKA